MPNLRSNSFVKKTKKQNKNKQLLTYLFHMPTLNHFEKNQFINSRVLGMDIGQKFLGPIFGFPEHAI